MPLTDDNDGVEYDAAISYRRGDGSRIATRLRTALQQYRFPKNLALTHRPLRIYIDRTYQRAAPDFFRGTIEPALAASRYLIVVLTPSVWERRADGTPNWVEREVVSFRSLRQGERILVARATGAPGDALPDFFADYANVDQVDVRGLGSPLPWRWRSRVSDEVVKFAATLHDVPPALMPEVRQEEARRRRKSLIAALAVVTVIAITTSALAWTAWRASVAEEVASGVSQQKTIDAYRAVQASRIAENAATTALSAEKRAREAEREAMRKETEARRETRQNFSRSDFLTALDLLARQNEPRAMAFLARALRTDPGNTAARGAAFNLLIHRRWARPLAAIQAPAAVQSVTLLPDGRVLLVSHDTTDTPWISPTAESPPVLVWLWDPRTGRMQEVATGLTQRSVSVSVDREKRYAFIAAHGYRPGNAAIIDLHRGLTVGRMTGVTATNAVFRRGGELAVLTPYSDQSCAVVIGMDGAIRFGPFCHVPPPPPGLSQNDPRRYPGLDDRVTAALFSGDGARLATQTPRGVWVWDLASRTVQHKCAGAVLGNADDTDEPLLQDDLLVGGENNGKKWQLLADGTCKLVPPRPAPMATSILRYGGIHRYAKPTDDSENEVEVQHAVFDRDRRRTAERLSDGRVRVWHIETGRRLVEPIADGAPIADLSMSEDGRTLATAAGASIVLWSIDTAAAVGWPVTDTDEVGSVLFSRDGRWLVGATGGKILVWDAATGAPRKRLRTGITAGKIAFASDSRRLLVTSRDGAAVLVDVVAGNVGKPMRQTEDVRAFFTDDERTVTTVSFDGSIVTFDPHTARHMGADRQVGAELDAVVIRNDGLAAISWGKKTYLWPRGAAKPLPLGSGISVTEVHDLVFSPSGDLLVVIAGPFGEVWNVASRRQLWTFARTASEARASFSPDGRRLTVVGNDSVASVHDARTGAAAATTELQHRAQQYPAAAFSPDGSRIALGSLDGLTAVDAASGRPLGLSFPQIGEPKSFTFNATGERIAVIADRRCLLYDVPIGREEDSALLADFLEHLGGVRLGRVSEFLAVPPAERLPAVFRELHRRASTATPSTRAVYDWFFAPPMRRRITPSALMTVDAYILDAVEHSPPYAARLAFPDHPLIRERGWPMTAE